MCRADAENQSQNKSQTNKADARRQRHRQRQRQARGAGCGLKPSLTDLTFFLTECHANFGALPFRAGQSALPVHFPNPTTRHGTLVYQYYTRVSLILATAVCDHHSLILSCNPSVS